ncbi:MAG TPA: glycosyltransferase [Bacteroidales bacterium]|nr:glycosyltransferase [Bacteroidales bacterium]
MSNIKKRILICPLDWGLGHATRCIPIIRALIQRGYEVIIGADNQPLALLRKEFPELEWIKFPGYNITYPSNSFMTGAMIKILPKFIKYKIKEHKLLAAIIKEKKIDAVISDNRYGLWSYEIPTVIITHQLNILSTSGFRWSEPIIHKIIRNALNKFSVCWIPDVGGPINFSGRLSHEHHYPNNAKLIGALSRFCFNEIANNYIEKEEKYKLMAIVSGPEPQRTIFENIITKQFAKNGSKSLIVRGLPEENETKIIKNNITYVNHLPTNLMAFHIINSEIIVCRSGYSTIMDLVTLKRDKNVILIPTPGQTEQEYLAKRMKSLCYFYSMPQRYFDLDRAVESLPLYRCGEFPESKAFFEDALNNFLKKLHK